MEKKDLKIKDKIKENNHYKIIFEEANDAIFIHDLKGYFLEVNNKACKRLGYSKEEFSKMTVKDIDAPEYSAKVKEKIEELKKKGSAVMETVHINKTGKRIPIELSSKVIDYRGEKAILSMARDISDRKEAENQLENMFSFSDFMACVADLKTGYFKKISPSFTDHLGWSNKELLSIPIAKFVHPDDLEKTENAIKKQKKEGVKIAKFENRYKTKEGSYRWLEWGAHSIPEKGLSYSVAYDVTEQKKVQNELKEKLDELEKMNKLMVGRELKMIEIKEQLESLKKGRVEKINKKTWNEKFIEAIELEEGAIKELGGSYVNLIKESDINNGDKKAIIKLLKRLEKDSKRHDAVFQKLAKKYEK